MVVENSDFSPCAGYLGYPFQKNALMMSTTPIFSSFSTERARFSTHLFPACFGMDIPRNQHMRRHSKNLGCGALARVANQHMLTSCEASVVALRAEPKRSTPRSPGKAFWRLGSGTQEEQRGSTGRIRHQRVGHCGICAQRHTKE